MTLPVALQLYTVRDALKADLPGTLAQVRAIGYEWVELAGLYDRTAAEFRRLLDDHGLRAMAAHVGVDAMLGHPAQVTQDARTLGYNLVICPWLAPAQRQTQGYAQIASQLNQLAQQLHPQGLRVGYHNHDFEFVALPDQRLGWDIILQTGSHLVGELDTCWAHVAGVDPVAVMRQYARRLPTLHIKDHRSADRKVTEIGTGDVNIRAIVEAAPACGVEYLVVEQDNHWQGSPVESARISYQNLQRILAGR